jgi:hypothetical protein
MTKQLWNRTTKTLGKLWAGMISLPDQRPAAAKATWTDYPRFPAF